MEVIDTKRANRLRISGIACTAFYCVGMVLIYLGERLWPEPLTVRLILDGIGVAGILLGLLGRGINWASTHGERRSVEGMILISYLGGLLALVLYAAQIDQVRNLVKPLFQDPKALDRFRTILQVLWPILWLCSVLPAIFMEISSASMARADTIERRRIVHSAMSGLTIALVICSLFVINYLASEHNIKRDMSYLKTSSPSKETKEMVSNLSGPFQVILFYPDVNEVKEELLHYFGELKDLSPNFSLLALDQALEPKKADEYKVSQNGVVVYAYGDRHETFQAGDKIDEARSKLAKFDEEFQKKFLELVAAKKIAYFTTGHGERAYEWTSDAKEDTRATIKGLRAILKGQHFETKPLGIGQGLGSEVPDDASVLFVIDPTRDFLPEEFSALRNYLDAGGHLFVALDPDYTTNVAGFIESYGVRFVPTVLANTRYYMVSTHTKSDRYNLFTNRTSSHASVTTLSRNASRLAVVLVKSGYLEKAGDKGSPRVTMTLHSMPMTWADRSGTMEPEGSKEEKTYEIAAAVEATAKASPEKKKEDQAKEGDQAKKDGQGKNEESPPSDMRMLVLADADALGDLVIGNMGNYYLVHDGLKWLVGEKKFMGKVTSEEDVRILHTKDEDVVWFYSMIFGVPLVVLGVGIAYNRLRGARRGKARET